MDNMMPMIFTPPDMRTMGQQMTDAMTPMLRDMNEIMRRRGDQLSRLGFQTMTAVMNAMQNIRGLRPDVFTVQVLNLDFLELMAAGSFAFLVLIFLKLHDWFRQNNTTNITIQQFVVQILTEIREVNIKLGDINFNTRATLNLTANINLTLQLILNAVLNLTANISFRLDAILQAILNLNVNLGGISLKLDDIIRLLGEISAKLSLINTAIVNLTARVDAIGAQIVGLLSAILAELRAGLKITGTIDLNVNIKKTIGFDIGWGDILKMLLAGIGAVLLLAAALAVLVGFVFLLGAVLEGFGLKAVFGMILALAALIAFIYLLRDAIKGFDLKQILLLALALGVLVIFVNELSKALKGFDLGTVIGMVIALAGLALFVYVLGKALALFNKDVLSVIPQLDKLFDSLIKLAKAIAGFSVDQMIQIGLGLLGIVIFLGLLGLVLRLFNADVLNALPGLSQLFDALIKLATAITKFTPDQMIQIGLGFLGIVVFLGLLGLVLRLFNADVLAALPGLGQLFDSLIKLAQAIAAFTPDQMIQIGIGLLGIVIFLGLLGLVLKLFNADVLEALPGLAMLFDALIRLAQAIAAFTPDQMIQIGIGLLGIVIFVGLLGLALRLFSDEALAALPALSMVLDSMGQLMSTIAGFSIGEMFQIAIGLAMLTAFLFGMAVALDLATPGLNALANALNALTTAFNTVASAAKAAWDAISKVPSISIPGIPGIPGFQTGGVMPGDGLAFLHAGERVLNTAETAAYDSAASAPPVGAAAAPGAVDQSVNIAGGINVTVNAQNMDAAAVPGITDEIVRQLQEKLAALAVDDKRRMGVVAPAVA
ncbi:MAG TPA: hypothetical protein VF546_24110 [Pyrinomonadaceae bacterium]|jgi:hypothetical protein